MRFWNHQVLTETEAVVQAVANALDAPTRLGEAFKSRNDKQKATPQTWCLCWDIDYIDP